MEHADDGRQMFAKPQHRDSIVRVRVQDQEDPDGVAHSTSTRLDGIVMECSSHTLSPNEWVVDLSQNTPSGTLLAAAFCGCRISSAAGTIGNTESILLLYELEMLWNGCFAYLQLK